MRVLMHFTLHFAAFNPAFCCGLPRVLLHLALRFAAKRKAKCSK
jgi:hypothetical protein